MAMLDILFDDFPLGYPSLRIPPLQDPFPDLSAQSARLSPLEPNARVDENIDNGTSKLTGRRKALAEAKPIGELTGSNDLRPIQRNPRKKPKLHEHERIADFVQLPQPNAKAKNDKPPPFQPVSILNELLEPPPSAALFPPITPKEGHGEPKRRSPTLSQSPCRGDGTPSSRTNATQKTIESPSSKRTSQRPRRKWTTQETEQLMKGIQLYGVGKWKKILHHPGFSFQPGRTPVDLKDQYDTPAWKTPSFTDFDVIVFARNKSPFMILNTSASARARGRRLKTLTWKGATGSMVFAGQVSLRIRISIYHIGLARKYETDFEPSFQNCIAVMSSKTQANDARCSRVSIVKEPGTTLKMRTSRKGIRNMASRGRG